MAAVKPPDTLAGWQAYRQDVRKSLWQLLGDVPPPFSPHVQTLGITPHDGYSLHQISFENGLGATVPGLLLIPDHLAGRAPAVLYQHFHGGKYPIGKDQLFLAKDATPDGIALVNQGYVVLVIDAYAFGERQSQGPAGTAESGAATELSLFKHFLWEGKTLWGMMLHDDLLALAYLRERPEVDPARIGTTGMSMGGSRATWLAALDDTVKVVIPIGQMTRYEDFAASGQYHLHSIYYYLPGMLRSGLDMEHLVSLAAPRPQRILIGDQDPLSPIAGVRKIEAYARHIYGLYGLPENFQLTVYDGIGHRYTPAMREAMRAGFRAFL
ncbi:MAG: dienelactone hydrolase family protein [Anaerolineaceae bacterium]|nr:dienelactone hydrolase family protein [Anaerolineaceae bacterium]